MLEQRVASLPPLLARIGRLLADTPCRHCGRPPYELSLADADMDRVDDEERWLWRRLADAEKVRASAPAPPPADEVGRARAAVNTARAALRAIDAQLTSADAALANPASWLRPTHRVTLLNQVRRDRAQQVAVAEQLTRAEADQGALDAIAAERTAYLAGHRDTLDAARNARAELDRRIDELIGAYAAMQPAPPWFTYGLSYPPHRDQYATWLRKARAAIAYRRRYGIDHPLEPLGTAPPAGTAQHHHWLAASAAGS